MKNIWIMTWFTLREAFARKVFISFAVISVVVIILTAVIFGTIDTDSIIGSLAQQDAMGIGDLLGALVLMIISPLSSLALLLAIFTSSSFVPVMLEKGNIDLLLSKPVSRAQMLTGKYLGGILVVLLNIAFLVIGVWLIISIKFAYWNFTFLWLIATITFTFAVLYALIVLLGVATKSSIPGMMTAYFIFIILSPLLSLAKNELRIIFESDFLKSVIDGLYYVVPKTAELMGQINMDLAAGRGIDDFQPVITSFLFLILAFGYSLFLFQKKDF
jgi:ABC-2 type transport system permease protein